MFATHPAVLVTSVGSNMDLFKSRTGMRKCYGVQIFTVNRVPHLLSVS